MTEAQTVVSVKLWSKSMSYKSWDGSGMEYLFNRYKAPEQSKADTQKTFLKELKVCSCSHPLWLITTVANREGHLQPQAIQ